MAFESLTDTRIQELLQMPKRVMNPGAHNVADANHDRRDYVIESADGTERFKLFVRQNKTITEDFSCGLQWLPPGGESLILALQRVKPGTSEQTRRDQGQFPQSYSSGNGTVFTGEFETRGLRGGGCEVPNMRGGFAPTGC